MINILFVDDDPDILDGFKRMLYQLRKEWNQYFALGGEEALRILAENEIDVIITDMKMPVMSGSQLLAIVQEKFPNVVRIILSGHNDEVNNIRTLISAHQYLIKPCDANKIRVTLESAIALRNMLENADLIRFVNSIDTLPMLPGVFFEVEQEISSEEISFPRISEIISHDPSLTLKILQTVNSGFFGLPRRITNLVEALSYLGVNIIKSIIIYLNLYSFDKISYDLIHLINEISNHSLRTAIIGKEIARIENLDKYTTDDIFTACILHDVGKLVIMKNPAYMQKLTEFMHSEESDWFEAERQLFHFTHESLGAYLLGIWGMPKTIIESAALHHNPGTITSDSINCLFVVYVANCFELYKEDKLDLDKLEIDFEYFERFYEREKLFEWWDKIVDKLKETNE